MSEKTLQQLFGQAREEKPETSLHEVLKWIGGGTIAMVLAVYAMKLKTLLFANPILVVGSVVTAGGITVGTTAMLQASGNPESKQSAGLVYSKSGKIAEQPADTIETVTIAIEEPVKAAEIKEKRTDSLSVLPFVQFTPLGMPMPIIAPAAPVAPGRVMKPLVVCGLNNYGDFSALIVSGIAQVVISQGQACNVRIEGNEKGMEMIVVKNNNGTLEISTKSLRRDHDEAEVIVYVTAVNLTSIEASGATSLQSDGKLDFPDFSLDMEGASNIDLELHTSVLKIEADGAANVDVELDHATDLYVESSGAANVSLEGTVDVLNLENSGAATFNGVHLVVVKAQADCSGASHSELNVTDNLDITVSGASHVKYKGSPTFGEKSVSGAAHLGHF